MAILMLSTALVFLVLFQSLHLTCRTFVQAHVDEHLSASPPPPPVGQHIPPPPPAAAAPPPPPPPAAAAAAPPPRGNPPDSYSAPVYTVDKVLMPGHSWDSPLTYDNNLSDWEMAMGSVPSYRHVVLTPAVIDRSGLFFNKYPVKTANFEIQFQFEVRGTDTTSNSDGFAFWYVYDDYNQIKPKTVQDETQWNFFGFQHTFRGLGVFFAAKDRVGKINPSISASMSDGTQSYNVKTDIPFSTGVYVKYRNSKMPHTFRLSAGPKGVIGELMLSSGTNWVTCFQFKDIQLMENGYVGFSAFTGADIMLQPDGSERPHPAKATGDMMTLLNFNMYNMDLSHPGEDIQPRQPHDINVGDILREHSHHKDQREQTEALKQLTRVIYKHVSEQSPREQSMVRMINSLMSIVQKMNSDVREMKREIQMVTGLNQTDVMQSMKSELSGLKNLFHRHSQHHANSLQSLTSKFETIGSHSAQGSASHVKEIKELSQRAASLEQTINTQSNTTSWLAVGILASLVGFGLFVWKRFRDMEKKHYL